MEEPFQELDPLMQLSQLRLVVLERPLELVDPLLLFLQLGDQFFLSPHDFTPRTCVLFLPLQDTEGATNPGLIGSLGDVRSPTSCERVRTNTSIRRKSQSRSGIRGPDVPIRTDLELP